MADSCDVYGMVRAGTYHLNFSDAFRPVAEERLKDDLSHVGTDRQLRSAARYALASLTADQVDALKAELEAMCEGREEAAELVIFESEHGDWQFNARLTVPVSYSRVAESVVFTLDRLHEVVHHLMDKGVEVVNIPPAWHAWYEAFSRWDAEQSAA